MPQISLKPCTQFQLSVCRFLLSVDDYCCTWHLERWSPELQFALSFRVSCTLSVGKQKPRVLWKMGYEGHFAWVWIYCWLSYLSLNFYIYCIMYSHRKYKWRIHKREIYSLLDKEKNDPSTWEADTSRCLRVGDQPCLHWESQYSQAA